MTFTPAPPPATARDEAACRLRAELRRNWKVGDRLPPIKTLAGRLGIGQTSAHHAARLLTDAGLLVARPRRGTFVARIPHQDAPATRTRRALLLRVPPDATDPFMQPAVDAMAERLARSSVRVEAHHITRRDAGFDLAALEPFDAMVCLQPSSRELYANDPKRPAVVLTTSEVEPMALMAGYDVVSIDEEHGACLAGRWMRGLAEPRVGYLGMSSTSSRTMYEPTSLKRLRGFEGGLGRPVARADRLYAEAHRSGAGAKVFETWFAMPDRPLALFCASDDLAIGFMHAAAVRGLTAGRDYHIVGFDGQTRGRLAPDGPLTTVAAPVEQMGRTAAELLLSRFDEPGLPVRRVLLACEMFEGATVRGRNR